MKANRMIPVLVALCIALPCCVWASSLPNPGRNRVASLDHIAAVINDQIITQSQLDQSAHEVALQLRGDHIALPSDKVLQRQVLQKLIYQALQIQLAQKMGISIDDSQLNQAVLSIAKRNKMNLAQFRAKLQATGVGYAAYRQLIHNQMLVHRVQQQFISDNITISDQEVNEYLRNYRHQRHSNSEYHVRGILIALPDTPTPAQVDQAKRQANKIMSLLHHGANFSKVAMAHSDNEQALQGGDLGWRHVGSLPNAFARRIAAMKVGAVIGPIRTPNGYHIITLSGVRNMTHKLTKAEARKIIFKRKFVEQRQVWLQKLHDRAYIKVML